MRTYLHFIVQFLLQLIQFSSGVVRVVADVQTVILRRRISRTRFILRSSGSVHFCDVFAFDGEQHLFVEFTVDERLVVFVFDDLYDLLLYFVEYFWSLVTWSDIIDCIVFSKTGRNSEKFLVKEVKCIEVSYKLLCVNRGVEK